LFAFANVGGWRNIPISLIDPVPARLLLTPFRQAMVIGGCSLRAQSSTLLAMGLPMVESCHLAAHPAATSLSIGASVFAVAFLLSYWPRRKKTFDFDVRGEFGAFEPHAKRYQDLAKLILTLSTASIAFVVNFLVGLTADAKTRSPYSLRLEAASPWVIAFLCLSTVSLLLFLLFENLFYEDYVHSKYTRNPSDSKETYTGRRYALNLTFAWTGLLWFFVAYMILAYRLF
jgi:hypothetical protein